MLGVLLVASSAAFLVPLPVHRGLSASLLTSVSSQLTNNVPAVPAARALPARMSSAPLGTEAVDYLFFIPFVLILGALGAGMRSVVLGEEGLLSQMSADDSIKGKIREARSTNGPAFGIRLPELRLPDLDFVEVYDQPPPAGTSRPKTADPPGYDLYRKSFQQRGVQLPGSAVQPGSGLPRSRRAEQKARLELELQQVEAAENYSGAARLRGELDALRRTETTPRSARLAAELAEAVAREDHEAVARLRRELAVAEEQPE